jgi:signal transduction histidine kinase
VRKQAEADLHDAKLRAEQEIEARVTFFNEMSHELRTPLNAVIGFASFMEQQIAGPIGNPRYIEAATDIRTSGEYLLALINDILDHAKAEAGYLELEEDNVSIADVIAFVVHLVAPRAAGGGVGLTKSVGAGVYAVRGDERRLRQVLLNLVTNAIKFTPACGHVAVEANLGATGELIIAVTDTGSGIALADQARIFEPFAQVKAAQRKSREGTGLGLPLTKRLVELHGGAVDVDSTLGVGTTISVRLPASRVVAPLNRA